MNWLRFGDGIVAYVDSRHPPLLDKHLIPKILLWPNGNQVLQHEKLWRLLWFMPWQLLSQIFLNTIEYYCTSWWESPNHEDIWAHIFIWEIRSSYKLCSYIVLSLFLNLVPNSTLCNSSFSKYLFYLLLIIYIRADNKIFDYLHNSRFY